MLKLVHAGLTTVGTASAMYMICQPLSPNMPSRRRCLSLQFGELQGDFHKMQGGGRRNLAKSHQISIAWNGVSLLKRAGKSRENNLCSAGWWRFQRPDTGDGPLEPRNLQHLRFSECQFEVLGTNPMGLRTGYATPPQSCLALTGAGSRGAGTVRSQAPRACPCRQQDRGKCRALLAIEL